jgi:hypothetical protein
MNPPPTLQRITTQVREFSPETMAEAKAARERIEAQEKRQRAADSTAEQHTEGRSLQTPAQQPARMTMQTPVIDLGPVAPLIMTKGVGDGKTTACVMAQAATIDALRRGETLEAATDEMKCACPVLRRLAIRLNDTDWWEDDMERTNTLRPLIPLLLDSRGDGALTDRRVFFAADQAVRVLTPMRLEWIAKHSKSERVREDSTAGARLLRDLTPITDASTARTARDACERLKASASASAYASADASASASAYASAYAYASASADAYAPAYADADAYAYADAYASASVPAQRLLYREACLKLFRDCAAIQ